MGADVVYHPSAKGFRVYVLWIPKQRHGNAAIVAGGVSGSPAGSDGTRLNVDLADVARRNRWHIGWIALDEG